MSSQIDIKLLRALEPLSHLTPDKLDELARKSRIEKLPAERILFRQGERNNRLIYILNGQIELSIHGQKKKQIIKGKTDQARYPLADEIPRHCTAKTKTETMLLTIDQDLLEILTSDTSQQAAIEVTELSGEHDVNGWMLRFLQSPAFLHLPTENIQSLLMKLEEVSFKKDQVIVQQGDESDFYYIVQQGRCGVSRRPAPNAQDIKLAILTNGDGFGEDALITGSKRNATITMLENGSLMRLNKGDFLELLIKPLINYYNEQEVIKNLALGSLVIDVRPHEAFMANHIDGSINIPLSMLRSKLPGLNPQRDYIVCCEDGSQSEAAAFLLIQQGLSCHVLKNGFKYTNIGTATPTAVKAPQAETTKTRQADESKHLAEARAVRLKQETEKARREADELTRRTQAAEQTKAAAQLDLKRLKEKELAQQQIEREAQRAQKAEDELQRLINEQSKNAEHQAALQKSLSQAEKVAQKSTRIAADAHKQAERDAEKIRQHAEKEASRLRADMKAEQRRHEKAVEKARNEEEKQQKAAIEDARQKAREVVKATAAEAKAEAHSIRQQAVQEAEALRAKVEETRSQIEKNIADADTKGELQRQLLLEEAQREAEKVARKTTQQAELEATQIRLKALEEAEKLRAEMEVARQLVEQEAEKIRLKQQQDLEADAKAKEAERAHLQQQTNKETQRQQKLAKEAEEKKHVEARQRAEAIKAQLEAAAKGKEQQQDIQSEGLSVAGVTVKETKDRIILESDEDTFIFKIPKITKIDKEKLLKEAASTKARPIDDLPSFEIDSDEPMLPKSEPQFIGTTALDTRHNATSAKRKNVFAIAAVMVMGIGLGGIAYMQMGTSQLAEQTALKPDNNKATANLLGKVPSSANNLVVAEKKENQKAEEEFESLLNKWKKTINN